MGSHEFDYDSLPPDQAEELRAMHAVFRQEFSETVNAPSDKAALRDLEDLKDDALAAIKKSITQRDNLKLSADMARWVYNHLIDQGKASGDALTDMLKEAEAARHS